jgi:putative aldouronate transport system substrate-binding protein
LRKLRLVANSSIILSLCGSIALAGCTADEKKMSDKKPIKDTSSVGEAGTFPIVKDKLNIKVFTRQDPKVEDYSYDKNDFTKYYEDKTNIHVDWQAIPTSALAEKLQVTLAGGDLPDVFMSAGLSPSQLVAYGSQGLFLPLNDLIEKYGPNIKKMMQEAPASKKYLYTPDGKIYGLPRYSENVHPSMPNKLWMNKVWLNNLGLQIPTTTEEFYKVLKAFKTQDPNRNGKQDEVPYAGSAENAFDPFDQPDSYLMQSFIFYDRDNYVMMDNGKVVFSADKPGFKEGLKYIRRLISEGLLTPESFTQDRKALTALAENPGANLLGAGTSLWWGFFTVPNGPRYKEYAPVSILAGPDGQRYGFDRGESVKPAEFVITKNAKNPEAIMRWIDHIYDRRAMFETGWNPNFGQEGKQWEKIKPGTFGLDGKTAAEYRNIIAPGTAGSFYWNQTAPNWSNTKNYYRYEVTPEMENEKVLYDTTVNMYKPYSMPDKKLPFLFFLPDDLSKYGDLQKNMTNTVQQFLLKFVTGNLDIDKDWDKYLKELNNAGLSEYLAILQKTYDLNKR